RTQPNAHDPPTGRRGAVARYFSDDLRQSAVAVETASRRADGCSRHFANRQLSEVRTIRSASSRFQTTYQPADSCPYCDERFSLYPLAFMQLSKAWFLVPASAKAASRSHSYKSRKRSLSLSFLVSLDPEGC